MKIVVDAMGGDNAPQEIVAGAIKSLEDQRVSIILCGKTDAIKAELNKHAGYDTRRVEIVDAPEIVTMDEAPTQAVKHKKNSSMMKGLALLKDKQADAIVSAGNTGALLAGATLIVGRIKGVERPVLATALPHQKGFSLLVDSGANVDAKPTYLLQYGKIASVYVENMFGIAKPRVGLLNIGAEKEKGNALTKEAYELLEHSGLNFIGNIEARDVPAGKADVVVCDAFVGNVVLKYTEGLAKSLLSIIKDELMSSFASKVGAMLAKGAFANVKKRFDYTEVGGAPFLGLNALVVKAHGSSNAKAIHSAIKQCASFSEHEITRKLSDYLS